MSLTMKESVLDTIGLTGFAEQSGLIINTATTNKNPGAVDSGGTVTNNYIVSNPATFTSWIQRGII